MSELMDQPRATDHIGELAELYALGVLEPQERADVDAHAAGCERCTRALGEAETAVAALDEVFVPRVEPPERLGSRIAASGDVVVPLAPRGTWPRPRSVPGFLATAAALLWPRPRPVLGFLATAAALLFAVGVGGGLLAERSLEIGGAARDSAVLATIATSHFNHVSFTARDPAAPVTKVLYARDGGWFYVIVDSAACNCRVFGRSAAVQRDLGSPEVHGNTATLFVRDFRRPTSLELVRASGGVLSSASLVY
jgi:hypothetical protein